MNFPTAAAIALLLIALSLLVMLVIVESDRDAWKSEALDLRVKLGQSETNRYYAEAELAQSRRATVAVLDLSERKVARRDKTLAVLMKPDKPPRVYHQRGYVHD